MKRIFIFALVCALAASCSTLKIVMNTTDADGTRTTLTSSHKLFGYKMSGIDVALGARVHQKDTVMAILVTCDVDSDHGIFEKDDKFMVRFEDGSVIELSNIYDREFEKETSTTQTQERVSSFGYNYVFSPWSPGVYLAPYEVVGFVPRTYTTEIDHSYALYLINKEQLHKLISQPAIKLRVEIENDELEMRDPASAMPLFAELYKCLKEGMNYKRTEF